jgi:signal transduction histidine kinase/DNA-binding response OmpR family regulator/HPt (histidine-containing phosphotransfer) domain-containing protein
MIDTIYIIVSAMLALAFPAVWRLGRRRFPEWSRACANWRCLALIPVLVVGVAAAGMVAGYWRGRMLDRDLRARLQEESMSVARTIDPDEIRQLSFTSEDKNNPVYRRLCAEMRLHSAAIGRRSLYSIAVRGSKAVFGPEGIPEGDALSSLPGTVYKEPAPGLLLAFRWGISYAEGPYTDEYGSFVSAFSPVKDRHSGETVLLAGVDIEATRWLESVRRARTQTQLFVIAFIALALLGFGLVTWRSCPRAGRRPMLRHAEVFMVSSLGIMLSMGAAWFAYEQQSRSENALFEQLAAARSEDVFGAARTYAHDQLQELARFIESQPDLTLRNFRNFAAPLVASGVAQAWEWIPAATPNEIKTLEALGRRELGTQFDLFERNSHGGRIPLKDRPDYFPVLYAEPSEGNLPVVGFDLGSEPVRRAALEEARRTGLPAATPPVTLIQGGSREMGVLIFHPIYGGVQPPGAAASHPAAGRPLRGFALAVVRLGSLLERSLPQSTGHAPINAALFHLRQSRQPLRVAPEEGSTEPAAWVEPGFLGEGSLAAYPVFLFNQGFEVVISREEEPLMRGSTLFALLAGVGGALMSLLAGLFVGALSHRRAALEGEVEARTRELLESNSRLADAALEARHLRQQAEAVSHSKSEFLANMSHEIRTSMNGVVAMSGLLIESPLTPEQRQCAAIVRGSAESLLFLINDVLDLSHAGVNGPEAVNVDFNLRDTVEQTVELLAVRAQEKGIEICGRLDPEVPVCVKGDAGRLRQTIVSLAGNAVTSTAQGGVSLEASVLVSDGGAFLLRFAITDTGPGIPPEERARLFNPFVRANGNGSGLGLAISKNLVAKMGGEIGVECPPGGGSTFWFTAAFQKSAASDEAPSVGLSGFRVLVVDGFAPNREWFARTAAEHGGRTTCVSEGEAALRELAEAARASDPYQAAFIDYRSPGIDGLELCRRINGQPDLAATRCVLLLPLRQPLQAANAPASPVAATLVKPLRRGQFLDVLARFSGSGATEQRRTVVYAPDRDGENLNQQPGTMAEAEPKPRSGLKVLIVDDNATNQEVAARILESMNAEVGLADGGRTALEALRNRRFDLVLMDCQMPGMDGFETTRRIREGEAGEENRSVVIFALTASAMAGDRELCLAAGMNDYHSKPVVLANLRASLRFWFGNGEKQPALAAPQEPAEAPARSDPQPASGAAKPGFQQSVLLERVMGKKVFARRVITAFLGEVPKQLSALAGAIEASDAPGARLRAHSIKGAAAAIGGDDLANSARAIEELSASGEIPKAAALLPGLVAEFDRVRREAEAFRDSLPAK